MNNISNLLGGMDKIKLAQAVNKFKSSLSPEDQQKLLAQLKSVDKQELTKALSGLKVGQIDENAILQQLSSNPVLLSNLDKFLK